jgi:hypothetical protein
MSKTSVSLTYHDAAIPGTRQLLLESSPPGTPPGAVRIVLSIKLNTLPAEHSRCESFISITPEEWPLLRAALDTHFSTGVPA